MKSIAINTATNILSIAIVVDDKLLYIYEKPESRDQGNSLITHIKYGLKESRLNFSDLDFLAVVTGPGSFTGIRIGLAAMRGISMAADKPLIGISSFDMFSNLEPDTINIVVVESWRADLYFSVLDGDGKELMPAMNEKPEIFIKKLKEAGFFNKKIIISGDAKEKMKVFFEKAIFTDKIENAEDVAYKSLAIFNDRGKIEKPVPYYLREADVTISSKIQKHIIEES